ncbi:transposase [Dapis sp. BLCC M229]
MNPRNPYPTIVLSCLSPRETDLFSAVLQDFAQHFEIGAKKRVILVLDRAGWHTSVRVSGTEFYRLEVPDGIHLFPLPPYSPELQPAERLWHAGQ